MQSTKQVREILKNHGISWIWTNKNKSHHTVKGIYADKTNISALHKDLKDAGYSHHPVPSNPAGCIVKVFDM
jgi:hypothetical protein